MQNKMKKSLWFFGLAFMVIALLNPACKRDRHKVDVPDIQSLYTSISYLDSLIRSSQVDSIGVINDHVAAIIRAYARRAQSPDDAAILDSLSKINSAAQDLLQFCNSSQANLDLLERDARALENQYRSGKMKIDAYTSALLEEEQILIDIQDQLYDKQLKALKYLKNQSLLTAMLSALPMQSQ
jgi:hypothetical protein